MVGDTPATHAQTVAPEDISELEVAVAQLLEDALFPQAIVGDLLRQIRDVVQCLAAGATS